MKTGNEDLACLMSISDDSGNRKEALRPKSRPVLMCWWGGLEVLSI